MPLLYVNPAGGARGHVSGKARVGKLRAKRRFSNGGLRPLRSNPKRARKRRQPTALAKYWAKARKGGAPKRRRARGGGTAAVKRRRKRRMPTALARYWKNRGKKAGRKVRARRNPSMAKKKRKHARRRRKAAGTKVIRRRRRRKSTAAPKRRRRRRKKAHGKRRARRRRRKSTAAPKRRRRRRKKAHGKRRARRRRRKSSRVRAARKGWRRRRKKHGPVYRASRAGRGSTKASTLMLNPGRKRRRRRRKGAPRRRRARGRARRYGRRYRRNPSGIGNIGKFIMDTAKKAVPVLLSLVGTRAIAKQVASRITATSRLGMFQMPVLSALTLWGASVATRKVSFLAKHKDQIMLGAGVALVESLISALAPASVKGMLGMGGFSDYVAVSDYLTVGGGGGMSDYVAVGGFEEELGIDQEMGIDQELGDWSGQAGIGGMSQNSMLAAVPPKAFLEAVPARSFTAAVPGVTANYDNPDELYVGVFGGGFGG